MQRQGEETHVTTEEARGASTPNVVRYVLIISFVLACLVTTIIWVTGAATTGHADADAAGGQSVVQSTK